MAEFFFKKLKPQELGFRKGRPGGGGRYIYISKTLTKHLPALSKTELNDSVLLPVVPPFSGRPVYCAYVYHNDRHCAAGGTRDEFRLYLNGKIDPESSYFEPDDLIVLHQLNGGGTPVFKLDRFQPGSAEYLELSEFMAAKTKQDFLIADSCPVTLETGFDSSVSPEISEDIIDRVNAEAKPMTASEPLSSEESASADDTRMIKSLSFRDLVMFFYHNKCAITGKSISYGPLCNLEAAHIRPDCHEGPMHPCNGLALSRDLHWAFDKGFFTLSGDCRVVVHDELRSDDILGGLHDRQIFIPEDSRARPRDEFIRHHNEHVFGLFKRAGNLRSL